MRNPKDLENIAEHISYEIEMMEALANNMKTGGYDQVTKNVYIEGFTLHARCLADFLYPGEHAREDDVVATDYFDNPQEFIKKLPDLEGLVKYLRRRTGKEIAHLTYERLKVTPELKKWYFLKIQAAINLALLAFFTNLPEDKRKWFRYILYPKN